MLVYGKNVFKELQNNVSKIRRIYLDKKYHDSEVFAFIKENNLRYEILEKDRLDRLVSENHQGIIVEINDYDYYSLSDVIGEERLIILDHLEDAHNFGAIIRTCEAAGIKSIIIPKDRSVLVNGTVMKTSSGALEYVKIVQVSNLNNTIDKLKETGYFIYAADMDGVDYHQETFADKTALVIGSEGFGVSALVKKNCDVVLSIPMKGHVNSLNASVAAAVLIYGMMDK